MRQAHSFNRFIESNCLLALGILQYKIETFVFVKLILQWRKTKQNVWYMVVNVTKENQR